MKTMFEFDSLASMVAEAAIPQRSALFLLPPVGAGTPQQESLVSVLVRTSRAHSVGTRQLIGSVFAHAEPEIAGLGYAKFYKSLAATINGLGKYAELFVRATERLTGQGDLRKQTLLPWKGLFPHNGQGLLAKYPQWCPDCLQAQTSKEAGTVFQLAWSLEVSMVCSIHRRPLVALCPQCGKPQPFLPRYPDLGVCDHCGSSLAGLPTAIRAACTNQDDLWVAEAIGNMLVAQTRGDFVPDVGRFREFVLEKVRGLAEGNRAVFCRALGLHDRALAGWLNKGERPSITQFLTLCYGTQVMPANVFSGRPLAFLPGGMLNPPTAKVKYRSSVPRLGVERRKKLEAFLQACLMVKEYEPVSKIAGQVGVSARSLRYWFPDLCDQLSARHQAAAKARSESYQAAQCRRVCEIVKQVRDSGQYPSRRRINALLRKERMSLAQPHLLGAYKGALISGEENIQE